VSSGGGSSNSIAVAATEPLGDVVGDFETESPGGPEENDFPSPAVRPSAVDRPVLPPTTVRKRMSSLAMEELKEPKSTLTF
jgi:hypothetical protein